MSTIYNRWLLATASTVALTGVVNEGHAAPQSGITDFNWSGWYVGLDVSATRHYASTNDVDGWGRGAIVGTNYVTPFFESGKTAFGFGGYAGYNWQINNFVAGIEADVNYVGAKKTFSPAHNFFYCGPKCEVSATNELNWLATLRGRAGIPIDRVLFYGTAGIALGGINDHWGYGDTSQPGTMGFSDSYFKVDEVRVGFVYGGGIEFAATHNLLMRLEVLHVDFGTSNSSFTGTPNISLTGYGTFTTTFKNSATIGRAGLSWRW